MSDIVVTVPARLWSGWLAEGDLPGQPWSGMDSHFWLAAGRFPRMAAGERVYVVALGRLRGYAPFTGERELACRLDPRRSCLIRRGGAVAVTIPSSIRGFQGWRYRWWPRELEQPFPLWQEPIHSSEASLV